MWGWLVGPIIGVLFGYVMRVALVERANRNLYSDEILLEAYDEYRRVTGHPHETDPRQLKIVNGDCHDVCTKDHE